MDSMISQHDESKAMKIQREGEGEREKKALKRESVFIKKKKKVTTDNEEEAA